MKMKDIPISVIRRMARYYRYLTILEREQQSKISSQAFADHLGLTASQVRQDLGCFGAFGHRGYGYDVAELKVKIAEILGISDLKKCILVGVGNLGTAILSMNYEKLGFDLVAAFDANPQLEGKLVRGQVVRTIDTLAEFYEAEKPEIAIICIPTSSVEGVVTKLYEIGIKTYLNFSHYDISLLYPDTIVETVHINDSMVTLRFLMDNQ